MGPDFPIGECAICVTIYNAEQPKVTIIQPASVLIEGTGVCRRHLKYTRWSDVLTKGALLAARDEQAVWNQELLR